MTLENAAAATPTMGEKVYMPANRGDKFTNYSTPEQLTSAIGKYCALAAPSFKADPEAYINKLVYDAAERIIFRGRKNSGGGADKMQLDTALTATGEHITSLLEVVKQNKALGRTQGVSAEDVNYVLNEALDIGLSRVVRGQRLKTGSVPSVYAVKAEPAPA